MRALTEQGGTNRGGQHGGIPNQQEIQNYDDADVYDFATLRHELGVSENVEEEEFDDGLGDQLVEEGDDSNQMTFGDAPVGRFF
jgi:DNA topoisomerase 2-associated protein PAT1